MHFSQKRVLLFCLVKRNFCFAAIWEKGVVWVFLLIREEMQLEGPLLGRAILRVLVSKSLVLDSSARADWKSPCSH